MVAIKEWIRRTFCSEELSRYVDGFATDDNDLLPVQQLLGYCASQTTQQVSLAIDHNLLMEASAGHLVHELDRVWGKRTTGSKEDISHSLCVAVWCRCEDWSMLHLDVEGQSCDMLYTCGGEGLVQALTLSAQFGLPQQTHCLFLAINSWQQGRANRNPRHFHKFPVLHTTYYYRSSKTTSSSWGT